MPHQTPRVPGASAVQQKAEQATERIVERAQSTFEHTKRRVTEQIRVVGQALQRATEQLRQEQQVGLAGSAQRIGDQVIRASDYLQNRNARELVDDLDRLARRQPAWFLGGAFLLGLISARFLKSSQQTGSSRTEDRSRLGERYATGSRLSGVSYGTP